MAVPLTSLFENTQTAAVGRELDFWNSLSLLPHPHFPVVHPTDERALTGSGPLHRAVPGMVVVVVVRGVPG